MSCSGGSFTPDGAYDSLWDNVKPMTGVPLLSSCSESSYPRAYSDDKEKISASYSLSTVKGGRTGNVSDQQW